MSSWVKARQCVRDGNAIKGGASEIELWVNLDQVTTMERVKGTADRHATHAERDFTRLNNIAIYVWDTPEELLAQLTLAPSVRRAREDKDPLAGSREMIARRGGMISG